MLRWSLFRSRTTRDHDARLKGLQSEIDRLRRRIEDDFAFSNIAPVHLPNASEPTVQVLFREFARAGDCVFDIGAHDGNLTHALSRIVGPTGRVIAFEAHPVTVQQLVANLAKRAQFNVHVMPFAVTEASGEYVDIFDAGAASGVTAANSRPGTGTPTITLDGACSTLGVEPTFLKIDIEGAEFRALQGADDLLSRARPTIVLEHNVGDDRALDLLRARGYWTMCCATYRETSLADWNACDVTNVLAIHGSRLPNTRFARPPQVREVGSFALEPVVKEPVFNGAGASAIRRLLPGRYIMTFDGAIDGPGETYSKVMLGDRILGQLRTVTPFFMRNHRHIVFDAEHDADYLFYISSSAGADFTTSRIVLSEVILEHASFTRKRILSL